MSARVFCNLCNPVRPLAQDELVEHLRDVHDFEMQIETWPDGQPVVIDETLEPEDFAS